MPVLMPILLTASFPLPPHSALQPFSDNPWCSWTSWFLACVLQLKRVVCNTAKLGNLICNLEMKRVTGLSS